MSRYVCLLDVYKFLNGGVTSATSCEIHSCMYLGFLVLLEYLFTLVIMSRSLFEYFPFSFSAELEPLHVLNS